MQSFPSLATTVIGSVAFTDVEKALDLIARACPLIPAWPQMTRVRGREDMVLQAADGLPCLVVDEENRRIVVETQGREEALTGFYEHFLSEDYDYFAVPPEAASGLEPFLKRARDDAGFGPEFLKVQICGPISFGTSVRTDDDKTLLDDPDLSDTIVKGLGAKAAWLSDQVRETGRFPLVFIDEPGLTGYGSAFSTLAADQVTAMINEAAGIVRSRGEALIGTHVCGNTDWGLLASADIDIVNLDAFGYAEHFALYPDAVRSFLDRGGRIAWGIIPTLNFTGEETADGLARRLQEAWNLLAGKGIDLDLIRERSLITPACGLGPISPEDGERILALLPQVQERL
jgi:hypothetical protein